MTWTRRDGLVSGAALRWIVCLVLRDSGRPMTIAEIATRVEQQGFVIAGRPGKTISDALRWEIQRNRVAQLARGRYQLARLPRSTEWSMRRRVAALRATPRGRVEAGLSLVADTSADVRAPAPPGYEATMRWIEASERRLRAGAGPSGGSGARR